MYKRYFMYIIRIYLFTSDLDLSGWRSSYYVRIIINLFIVIKILSITDTCIPFIDTYSDLFHIVWPIAVPDVDHMNMNK